MNVQTKRERVQKALIRLQEHEECCRLCPRECGVNRRKGERGYCRAGNRACLSHALLHMGEEPVLSGCHDCGHEDRNNHSAGSGTIFFSGCHLKCLFCQNYQLSWQNKGKPVKDEELAAAMMDLQGRGALNINFVSPSHLIIPILRALQIAYKMGLNLPLVYNSNGYEKETIIRELEGIVDIFLPDFKYSSADLSQKYSGVSDYFFYAGPAIREMARQRPSLIVDGREIAQEGVIIRHLVLPGQVEDSLAVLDWIGKNIDARIGLSLMSQFQPCFKAPPELRRPVSEVEYKRVLEKGEKIEAEILFIQSLPSTPEESLVPDFNKNEPFNWHD
ncbi:MAG: hypothetical protein JXB23_16740 [Candidatus Aminicenantes bacterium]|nr:hypothetical protein [Candidatus Aminicenantes bacterium]